MRSRESESIGSNTLPCSKDSHSDAVEWRIMSRVFELPMNAMRVCGSFVDQMSLIQMIIMSFWFGVMAARRICERLQDLCLLLWRLVQTREGNERRDAGDF